MPPSTLIIIQQKITTITNRDNYTKQKTIKVFFWKRKKHQTIEVWVISTNVYLILEDILC